MGVKKTQITLLENEEKYDKFKVKLVGINETKIRKYEREKYEKMVQGKRCRGKIA